MEPTWSMLGMSWPQAGLTILAVIGLYAATVLISRLLGQRQFATLSSYDVTLTFAVGAIVGRGVLIDTSPAGAALALLTMFLLHAALGWVHHRVPAIHVFMQNAPILVVAHGQILDDRMLRAKLTAAELHQFLRAGGHGSLAEVQAAILEPSGELSIITTSTTLSPAFLDRVDGAELLTR